MSKADEVCKQYYKDKCHVCPLRPKCCQTIEPGKEKFNSWVKEAEQAAEEILRHKNK